MIYEENRLIKHLVLIILFVLSAATGFAQQKLEYGSSEFKSRTIEISKLSCKITPVSNINENNPDIIKLSFRVEWLSKKGEPAEVPDKFSLFFVLDNNLQDYLDDNNKKKQTKPSVTLINSLAISPKGALAFAPYRSIYFANSMAPVNIKILKHTDLPLGLELLLYVGKEKGNTVEIDEATETLSWSFYLPEKKAKEMAPCSEVVSKYQELFDENKPAFQIGYFKTSLTGLEQAEYPLKEVYELDGQFKKFLGDINSLELVKSQLVNDPDYNRCTDLLKILGSIDNYLIDDDALGLVKEDMLVAKTLAKAAGDEDEEDSEGGGGADVEFSQEVFIANIKSSEGIYFQLFDIDAGDVSAADIEKSQFEKWRIELESLNESVMAMYGAIAGTPQESKYSRQYKNFQQYYSEAISIIAKYAPEDVASKQSEDGEDEADTSSKKGIKIPWMWILIPVFMIAMGLGLYKYLGYIKKGKSASSKVK
ncbi:MAG: hypothetical protein R2764_17160 [Bacteroidales bacterium]